MEKRKKESIHEVAKNLLSKYKGNSEKTTSALKKIFLTESKLFGEYWEEVFYRAAASFVQSITASYRSSLFKPIPTLPKGVSGESQQVNIVKKTAISIINETEALLNMALNLCKKQLRFATRDDLAEEINMFVSHARGNDSRHIFLKMVYENLEENETVESQYTESDLRGIMEKTNKTINKKWKDKFVTIEELIET